MNASLHAASAASCLREASWSAPRGRFRPQRPPITWLSRGRALRLLDHRGQDLEGVADDAEVGHLEDPGVAVLVDVLVRDTFTSLDRGMRLRLARERAHRLLRASLNAATDGIMTADIGLIDTAGRREGMSGGCRRRRERSEAAAPRSPSCVASV
jgi:hypothetical protein